MIALTMKGGLAAATFREVAAEAGVSVRLVQYYFGSKDQLLLATQQHVAAWTAARIASRIEAAGDDPLDALRAALTAFVPTDDESREAMVMFVALHTESLLDATLFRPEARAVPQSLVQLVRHLLTRARLRPDIDADMEATILVALVPSLGQAVLGGMTTSSEAIAVIDYAVRRLQRK